MGSPGSRNYHYLSYPPSEDGIVTWQTEQNSQEQKSILHKLLHDADCLDIIRACEQFNPDFLDFFQDVVKKKLEDLKPEHKLPASLLELSQLICEVRGLIEFCGDTRLFSLIEGQNNKKNCNSKIRQCVRDNSDEFPIVTFLSDTQNVSKNLFPTIAGVSYAQPQDNMMVFRGVPLPSGVSFGLKQYEPSTFIHEGTLPFFGNKPYRSNNELAFAYRKNGVLSETETVNSNRSVSILGNGSGLFTNAWYVYFDQNIENISNIYPNGNARTGIRLKTNLKPMSDQEKKKTCIC